MITADVYSKGTFIGTADLVPGDVCMGHVYGAFHPTEQYYSDVQGQVQFNCHNMSFFSNPDWESLDLTVQLKTGEKLLPEGGITIEDELDYDGPLRIDIAGIHSDIIEQYFTA
ncbi:MAG: hypothetical protein JST83_09635 [Bacteroidetes bacterium]|nr:hypothetical protein [Bacteroidota bacterium]